MKKHQIVEVMWLDSMGSNVMWEWQDTYDDSLHPIKTIGYFIKQTKDAIIICQSVHDDQYGRVYRIPRGCVKEVKQL